jgi:hypothetical protein
MPLLKDNAATSPTSCSGKYSKVSPKQVSCTTGKMLGALSNIYFIYHCVKVFLLLNNFLKPRQELRHD